MSLATLSTQAMAVRKHGGGLPPIQRPTQQAGGHPLRSKGGEINSLCCVAAGIINLLLRAAASHAYPTTCVRRAPFTAAPLRSQNRPPAQLVVGCKQPLQLIRAFDQAVNQMLCAFDTSNLSRILTLITAIRLDRPLAEQARVQMDTDLIEPICATAGARIAEQQNAKFMITVFVGVSVRSVVLQDRSPREGSSRSYSLSPPAFTLFLQVAQ